MLTLESDGVNAGESTRGALAHLSPDAPFRGHLGVAAMVGLQLEGVAVPVGDEDVMVVEGEQRQLAARGGPHAAHDEPHRQPRVSVVVTGDSPRSITELPQVSGPART
jgi:hypothetical protein